MEPSTSACQRDAGNLRANFENEIVQLLPKFSNLTLLVAMTNDGIYDPEEYILCKWNA